MAKRVVILLLCMAFVLSVAVGCQSNQGVEEQEQQEQEQAIEEIKTLRLGAGVTGGTFFPMMTAAMVVINENIPGIMSTVIPGNSVANAKSIDNGTLDIAITYQSIAYEAVNGIAPAFEKEHGNIKAIGGLAWLPFAYYVNARSNIHSLGDLKGKSIMVGAAGSGTESNLARLLEAHGLSFEAIKSAGGKIHNVSYGEGVSLMRDRLIDMGVADGATPDPNIMQVESVFPVRVLNIDNDLLDRYIADNPGTYKALVPKGSYKGHDEDAWTLAWGPMLVVRADLSEDLVYQVTKAIFENPEEMGKGAAFLANISPTSAVEGVAIDFHPGAMKYFKEVGVLQ
jgi:TRAP transporter TAXI family solute receptor